MDGSLPSATRYALTSMAFVSPEIISLLPGTPAYAAAQASGRVTIAVYGDTASSSDLAEFFLQVGTAGGVTEMPDGATLEGTVLPGLP